jgi:hypothetical protein
MSVRHWGACTAAITLLGWAGALAAQDTPGAQQASSHACAAVIGAQARLACYDRAFPPTPQVHAAQAEQQRDAFGRQPVRTEAVEVQPELSARVVMVDYQSDATRLLALDNGQQWLLTEGGSRGHLAVGEAVTLRRGAMGGYLLRTAAGVTLRARRVR